MGPSTPVTQKTNMIKTTQTKGLRMYIYLFKAVSITKENVTEYPGPKPPNLK